MTEEADKYPNVRRVVTGHDETGRSYAVIDDLCTYHGAGSDGWRVQDIWEEPQIPIAINASDRDPTAGPLNFNMPDTGLRVRISDIPPTAPGFQPFRHRTNTVDYLYVLEGEIVMQFDDADHEIVLRKGDAIVQRATNHCWINRSDKHCRLFIVMVAGRITPDLEKIIGAMPAWDPDHPRE